MSSALSEFSHETQLPKNGCYYFYLERFRQRKQLAQDQTANNGQSKNDTLSLALMLGSEQSLLQNA